MAERKLTLKEIVDKVYIDLPEDENISEDEPSSENDCSLMTTALIIINLSMVMSASIA